jgi:hypothetical protein
VAWAVVAARWCSPYGSPDQRSDAHGRGSWEQCIHEVGWLMHWGTAETLLVVAGAIIIVVALVAPEASAQARLKALLGGAVTAGYGIYMASQTSGIFFIPVVAIALGFVLPVLLYREFRDQRQRRAIPSLAPGTPGARHCLGCGRAYPAGITRSCPACRGTLAPPSSSTTESEE